MIEKTTYRQFQMMSGHQYQGCSTRFPPLRTARNLHLIDVRDVDGVGRDKRPGGRIFYTENKSLLFYAFDLVNKRVLTSNYALQAWGYRESNDQAARSLGFFYVGDQKQKRWALKFDDPGGLQQIDAVFVTIEPPGGSKSQLARNCSTLT